MSKLRDLTLGIAPKFRTSTVELEGGVFEIRSPTIPQRAAIMKRSGFKPGDDMGAVDMTSLMVTALIELVYDPDTKERVFTEADRPALLEYPVGSFVDTLSQAAMKMFNVGTEAQGN